MKQSKSSVRNLLWDFGCYFVICMSFPWKGCFDEQIPVSWNLLSQGCENCVFFCDVKYHMRMRSHLHSWLCLIKIPWVILLLLPIKASKEAGVMSTFVNWFHPSFLFIMIPLLEFECTRQQYFSILGGEGLEFYIRRNMSNLCAVRIFFVVVFSSCRTVRKERSVKLLRWWQSWSS